MMESTRSTGQEDRVLLAMVSQYTDKYFWNEELGPLPEEIRKEVLVLLIMITEEAGGITVMGFEEDGEIYLASTCEKATWDTTRSAPVCSFGKWNGSRKTC